LNFKELYFEQCPMNVKQVMEYLDVGRTTLNKYIHEYGLPCSKVDRKLRFWKKEVDQWLSERSKNTNETKQNETSRNKTK
jgi:excisionase family DNA binding protein